MVKVNVWEINESEDIALVTADKESVTNSYEEEAPSLKIVRRIS
jgi:hypothetical protein